MSPHAWTVRPDVGVPKRSAAITAAEPRRNANGDSSIRAWRTGTSCGSRVAFCACRMLTGSARAGTGT